MSNYTGKARTNYVDVTDIDALREDLSNIIGLELIEKDGKYGFIFTHENPGAFYDHDVLEFVEWFSPYMEDGEVCIHMEIGSEGTSFLEGTAIAFDNKGREIRLSLDMIYAMARQEFRTVPTHCEY